jgi:hypothetical protein
MLEFLNNLCMGARNRAGIGMSNLPAKLHRLAELIPGLLKSLKIRARYMYKCTYMYLDKARNFNVAVLYLKRAMLFLAFISFCFNPPPPSLLPSFSLRLSSICLVSFICLPSYKWRGRWR